MSRNNAGFGLIEFVISAGMMMIVLAGVSKLMTGLQISNRASGENREFQDLLLLARVSLYEKSTCVNGLSVDNLDPTALANPAKNVVRLDIGNQELTDPSVQPSHFGNLEISELKFVSMQDVSDPSEGLKTYFSKLRLRVKRRDIASLDGPPLSTELTLVLKTDFDSGNVVGCSGGGYQGLNMMNFYCTSEMVAGGSGGGGTLIPTAVPLVVTPPAAEEDSIEIKRNRYKNGRRYVPPPPRYRRHASRSKLLWLAMSLEKPALCEAAPVSLCDQSASALEVVAACPTEMKVVSCSSDCSDSTGLRTCSAHPNSGVDLNTKCISKCENRLGGQCETNTVYYTCGYN